MIKIRSSICGHGNLFFYQSLPGSCIFQCSMPTPYYGTTTSSTREVSLHYLKYKFLGQNLLDERIITEAKSAEFVHQTGYCTLRYSSQITEKQNCIALAQCCSWTLVQRRRRLFHLQLHSLMKLLRFQLHSLMKF